MTGFKSKKTAALDEDGMYLVHHTAQPEQDATMQSLKDLARSVCDEVGKAAFAQPAQDSCFCHSGVSLQMVSGGAAPEGYLGWVTLLIDGAYVDYVRARPAQEQVARIAVLEAALNEIAYAGMSVSQEMSDDYKQAWHASRAWEFIGIAAQAIDQESTPAQEPVAWQFMNGSTFRKRRPEDFSDLAPDGFPYWKPLYTTLPVAKRPWVGLTHEEAQWLYDNCRTQSNLIDMTEAKLKDKNNG